MAIQITEVDGVPTLIAPSAGAMHAGLVFRVGRADEPLSRSGLTHVLEHLVLFPLGLTDYHYNGSTGSTVTSFHTSGSEQDVATFLHRVCQGLTAPPVDRLEVEKQIVRTEWASRTQSVNESMPMWRYGATGHGLMTFREPGTVALTPQDLMLWRDTWFTRENAVLWIAGDGVPAGLRLSLPTGRRIGLPAVTSALPVTPAYYSEGNQAVVFDAVVPSVPAASVFAEVLERTLFRDLRQEGGISYTVTAGYEPRGDGFGNVVAAVDALPKKQAAAVGGFVDALAKIQVGRIEQADIDAYRAKAREGARHPDAEASRLSSAAFAMLTGRPVRDLEQVVAELEAVTVDDVHAVALQARDTALLQVPAGLRADWAGFTAAPTRSASRLDGVHLKARSAGGADLILGAEGITSVCDDVPVTVRFDQVAVMWAWPDGGRRLVGHDGFTISVEPTLNPVDANSVNRIDAAVAAELTIRMPARSPDTIPKPQPSAKPAASKRGPAKAWEIVLLVVLIVATTLVCCSAGLTALLATSDDGSDTDIGWGPAIFMSVCSLIFLVPSAWLLMSVIRRRKAAADG